MSVSLGANGNSFNYPQTDDTAWGDDATNWASAVSAALSAIGLGGALTANAVINLQSTTKGFLPPRMTTVQRDAIATPTEGLLIYNTTTDLLNVYNGGAWVQFPISDALITNRLLQYDGTKIVSSTVAMSGSDMTVSGNIASNGLSVTGAISATTTASITGTATVGKLKTDDIEANTSAGLVVNSANGTDVARFGATNTSTLEALGDIVANNKIRALSTSGILIESADGTDVVTFGASNNPNASFNGAISTTTTATIGTVLSVPDGTAAAPSVKVGDEQNGLFSPGANELGFATGGAERLRILGTGQIQAVYESTVGTDYNTTLHNGYLCRAWVNFNGTGTVAIRASGNVSSITDNNTGDYTINFATALPDANYAVGGMGTNSGSLSSQFQFIADSATARTSSLVRINTASIAGVPSDSAIVSLEVFR